MFCENRWLQVTEETPAAVGLAALEDDWVDGEDYCDEEGNVDFEEIGAAVIDDDDKFFEVGGKIYFVPVDFVEEFKKAMHIESTAKKKNNIEVLKNSEFGEVRMIVIDNEPWFAAHDVEIALGYSQGEKITSALVDSCHRILMHRKNQYRWGIDLENPGEWFVDESGLFQLVLASTLPNANKVNRWLISEVFRLLHM